jgi:hypothetical protein
VEPSRFPGGSSLSEGRVFGGRGHSIFRPPRCARITRFPTLPWTSRIGVVALSHGWVTWNPPGFREGRAPPEARGGSSVVGDWVVHRGHSIWFALPGFREGRSHYSLTRPSRGSAGLAWLLFRTGGCRVRHSPASGESSDSEERVFYGPRDTASFALPGALALLASRPSRGPAGLQWLLFRTGG